MYLLDTNVVSELRKSRPDPKVKAWASGVETSRLYLSVITILELERGVLLIERRDSTQGEVLRRWLNERLLPAFAERVLAIDTPVAQRCAALHVPNPCSERDALIAATASVHGMTVVTRNSADFEPTGVAWLNPWQAD
ncbi:MAG: type II toxin-antitoxin system VapC family toxin [Candidatus Competibacteraceae bacterium]|jgi:predicted nucleic acid-binding protein|nr:type II toxin-antitoxin system VapC family toxin [Candidatus Competibacteraceae bacterium]